MARRGEKRASVPILHKPLPVNIGDLEKELGFKICLAKRMLFLPQNPDGSHREPVDLTIYFPKPKKYSEQELRMLVLGSLKKTDHPGFIMGKKKLTVEEAVNMLSEDSKTMMVPINEAGYFLSENHPGSLSLQAYLQDHMYLEFYSEYLEIKYPPVS